MAFSLHLKVAMFISVNSNLQCHPVFLFPIHSVLEHLSSRVRAEGPKDCMWLTPEEGVNPHGLLDLNAEFLVEKQRRP